MNRSETVRQYNDPLARQSRTNRSQIIESVLRTTRAAFYEGCPRVSGTACEKAGCVAA